MKKLFDILSKDIHSEQFTAEECLIYGVLAPLGLVAIVVLSSIFD